MVDNNRPAFAKYELMALAERLGDDVSRKEFIGEAVTNFYNLFGLEQDDPIINNAINTGAIQPAIKLYAGKFGENYDQATVGEVAAHFNYADASERLKALFAKYKDRKISEVKAEAKNRNQEALKVIIALEKIKVRHFESDLWRGIVDSSTKRDLEGLVTG